MKNSRCVLTGFFMIFVFNLFAQDSSEIYNDRKADSLRSLSKSAFLSYVQNGGDMNEALHKYSDGRKWTVFAMIAHDFGFYCKTEDNEFIYQILRESGSPIENPLFFMNDACRDKVNDILEYFSLLVRYNHGVTEQDFKQIRELYFSSEWGVDINYRDKSGKTLLMYACEFNYLQSATELINENANLDIADNFGYTALLYACAGGNKKILDLLLAKGANTRVNSFSAKALDYCISDSATDMAEKFQLYQEREFGYPFLVFQKGNRLKKVDTQRQLYFEFFTDIAGDTLASGTRKTTGKIQAISPDSIQLFSQTDEISKCNFNGESNSIRWNYHNSESSWQTFAKNKLFLIKYQSKTANTFSGIGAVVASLGAITSLIIAPLISINYSNGNFNRNLYYACALSGLGAVTISIPMLVFSRA
jgi:hypothetical protein